jgi:hypothetical protein
VIWSPEAVLRGLFIFSLETLADSVARNGRSPDAREKLGRSSRLRLQPKESSGKGPIFVSRVPPSRGDVNVAILLSTKVEILPSLKGP